QTLRAGTQIFDLAAQSTKSSGATQIAGDEVFKLHDTFGFPFDLTLEMASEAGLAVDEEGFRRLMKEQRDRAKADARAKKSGHADLSAYREILERAGASKFLGYERLDVESRVAGILHGGAKVESAQLGDEVEIVLEQTPFYAEGGGQLADGGIIQTSDGAIIEIDDVQSPLPGLIVHRGRVIDGSFAVAAGAHAKIDIDRRRAISRAHTATHLVHKAFREHLGETATQAGSENAPGRFRFDFAATGAIPLSMMQEVEAQVNGVLSEDLAVTSQIMTLPEAKAMGAMALFGEKYGESVRVVSVGEWTSELCGGTHAERSGQLGVVKLLGESSIGAGVRRVEALVGRDAYSFLAREYTLLNSLTEIIKGARTEELPERINNLVTRLREVEKELSAVRAAALMEGSAAILAEAISFGEVTLIAHRAPSGASADDVRKLALDLKERLKGRNAVVAIAGDTDSKPFMIVATDEGARAHGASAGALAKSAASVLGGGGGGKDDLAQGGGVDVSKIGEALAAVTTSVQALK
ncbi:MAG: alanine--tRNA ligase, partial [Actinobacteria bacterium]|nr:alanine--tRNA ligase [Actinomycetota bacterium]